MGQAYEIGRAIPLGMLICFIIFLIIPAFIGLCAWSWLCFFISLLVECVIFFVICKIIDKKRERRFAKIRSNL